MFPRWSIGPDLLGTCVICDLGPELFTTFAVLNSVGWSCNIENFYSAVCCARVWNLWHTKFVCNQYCQVTS